MKQVRQMKYTISVIAAVLITTACTQQPSTSGTPAPAPPAIETIAAELVASDKTWGNTEGPTFDSKNNLYFCARGTYKGIVRWNEKDGAEPWLVIATKEGPGGLWADDKDNIYLTAIGERQILMVTP